MIDAIDAHVHVWTDDLSSYPRQPGVPDCSPRTFTPDEFLARTRPNGVTRAVLVQMSFFGFDNSYMLDSMRAFPGVFGGIAVVNAGGPDPCGAMKPLARAGVRGFRVVPDGPEESWWQSPGMRAMWHCAAESELAICPLVNPDALEALGRMCARYPQTTVVIDHFARIGMDGQVRDADIARLNALARHPRVYVKVSAFYALGRKTPPYSDLAGLVQRVFEAYGPERLMWGSDSPFQVQPMHTYEASIQLIREGLPFLSERDRACLLRHTAERLFFA